MKCVALLSCLSRSRSRSLSFRLIVVDWLCRVLVCGTSGEVVLSVTVTSVGVVFGVSWFVSEGVVLGVCVCVRGRVVRRLCTECP